MSRALLYAGISAFSDGYSVPYDFAREDTSKARKERKDRARVLTMIHEEETKGMPSKRRLPRSKRRNRK